MTRAPVRLLAVDPSLSATGFVLADLDRHAGLHWVAAGTTSTAATRDDGTPVGMPARLAALYRAAGGWCERLEEAGGLVWVVSEDPSGPFGRINARTVYAMGLGVGAVLAALSVRLPPARIVLVHPTLYLPKQPGRGAAAQRRERVIAEGRALLPTTWTVSEHVCMAAYLARWWLATPKGRTACA